MVYLVLSGEQANAAAVAELPPDVSPAASGLFPAAALVDNRVSTWWSQGAIAANSYIRQDLNRILNGGLESGAGNVFTSWTKSEIGAGSTVTEETGIPFAGARCAKLTVGANPASSADLHQTVRVRSNSRRRGTVSLYAGVGATVKLEIYNATTGRWLDPTGAWVNAVAYHKTVAVTAWTTLAFAYRVQSRRQCCANLANIRYRVVNESLSTVGYFDELREWPEINAAILASHNVTPATPVQLRTSTDGWVANDVHVATLAPRESLMYGHVDPAVTARHVALKFTGTPPEALRATEALFGYMDNPADSPVYGFKVSRQLRQIRSSDQSFLLASCPEDGIDLSHEPHVSELEDLEDFVARGLDGSIAIVVPSTVRDEVILGRIPPSWGYTAVSHAMTAAAIRIEPLAFPLWTP